jgi:hypothetical protein
VNVVTPSGFTSGDAFAARVGRVEALVAAAAVGDAAPAATELTPSALAAARLAPCATIFRTLPRDERVAAGAFTVGVTATEPPAAGRIGDCETRAESLCEPAIAATRAAVAATARPARKERYRLQDDGNTELPRRRRVMTL